MHVDVTSASPTQTEHGRWVPLNGALGISNFGVNGVIMEPGDNMEHSEGEGGQQEVYIVVSGRARFVVDGEVFEGGVGTVVGLPDPTVVRDYQALEPDTRLVCVGRAAEPEVYGAWIVPV